MIVLIISIVFALVVIIIPYYKCKIRYFKQRNKVHFYVARDKNGELWLYLGKPERWCNRFSNFYGTCRNFTANEYHFEDVGLNPNNFKDLKWEDEPIEVFVNMED